MLTLSRLSLLPCSCVHTCRLPSNNLPSASIAAHHADMTGVGDSISNIYTGQLNSSTFIVVWERWSAASSLNTALSGTASTIELILHDSGNWWVNYVVNRYPYTRLTAAGLSVTVGIQESYYKGVQYCDSRSCDTTTLASGTSLRVKPVCNVDMYEKPEIAIKMILGIVGGIIAAFVAAAILMCVLCCSCCGCAARTTKRATPVPQQQQQQIMYFIPNTVPGTPPQHFIQQQQYQQQQQQQQFIPQQYVQQQQFQQQQQQQQQNRPLQLVQLQRSPGGTLASAPPMMLYSTNNSVTTTTAATTTAASTGYRTPDRNGTNINNNNRPPAYSPDHRIVVSNSSNMDSIPIVEAQYVNDGTIYAIAVPMHQKV